MSTWVKICGLTTVEHIHATVAQRPDAIGLVFARSPRRVTPEHAARLLAAVPAGILKLAVFRTPSPRDLAAIAGLPLDGVQADAHWDGTRLPEGWRFVPAFKDGPELLDRIRATPIDDLFLVDGPVGGGMGVPAEHARAVRAARLGAMILAGGLRPETVRHAIEVVRPFGVDVSSGVESSPGLKDPKKVVDFLRAARRDP